MQKTTVDVGAETLQIVCGAPNVAAGQKVVVATVGQPCMTIKGIHLKLKRKIRGEASVGMICGADEIGMGAADGGIMVLDETENGNKGK